jgi:uncharacterized protein YndB with AHSA1/START domain
MTTDQQADEGSRLVVLRREWPDPIDDVWAALTESERTARWIGTWTERGEEAGTSSGPQRVMPGDPASSLRSTERTVQFTMTGEADAGGEVAPPVTVTIVECDPPRRLVLDIPEGDKPPWRVAVTLNEEAGRTVLLFEQRVIEAISPADVEAGWSWYLDRLGAVLHDEPMPSWTYTPEGESS